MSLSDETVLEPAEQSKLFGHGPAERTLAQASEGDRLAHAWLFAGPEGIGKMTLAIRFARHLLGADDSAGDRLNGSSQDPQARVFRLVASDTHPDLLVVRRPEKAEGSRSTRRPQELTVDQVRKIASFLSLSASDGGWRVVIVDEADRMNRNAANALLKCLEEPPRKTLLILITLSPGRVLPTIRSRCRRLALSSLDEKAMREWLAQSGFTVAEDDLPDLLSLADGSPGRLARLIDHGGLETHRAIDALMRPTGRFDWKMAHKLGDRLSRTGAEDVYDVGTDLISRRLQAEIMASARQPNGNLDRLVKVWEKAQELLDAAKRANLDKRTILLQIFASLSAARHD